MKRRALQLLAVAVLVVGSVTVAQAASVHSLGRWLGLGWSDGYHAREGQGVPLWVETSSPMPRPAPQPGVMPVEPKREPAAAPTGSSRRTAPKLPSERMGQRPVYRYH